MPTHDIIDNRNEKLVDHINRILSSTEAARFAVGYFFLSGFESIARQLEGVKELRLLIGNTTNSSTIEELAEGYGRLDLVKGDIDKETFPRSTDIRRMAGEAAEKLRETVELMDQTDEGEALVKSLERMIEEKRLKVRVYTRGRLHAKAYIFDYGIVYDGKGKPVEREEKGIAVVGSSNLTLSGVTHNTELNIVVGGNENHKALVTWFDALWDEAEDFDQRLMQEMKQSWAAAVVRPYDIYMKTLYTLVKDRLEGGDGKEILYGEEIITKLADFQKVAVEQAIGIMREYGGVFISDVVGLGKSYIGAAIIKHFEQRDRARPLIICPAPLVEMWERYNEDYELNARVLSMGALREDDNGSVLTDRRYRDRDLLLIDESHNFRYSDTQRYKVVKAFLDNDLGRKCCFLTATPRNKSAWDVYHQIKLFHREDKTDLPIDPPNLRDYFRLIDDKKRKLPDLLSNILIRRTRNHILRWYGCDAETNAKVDPTRFGEYIEGWRKAYVLVGGRHQFFPKRELETVEYSIGDTYQGLYQQLRGYIGKPRTGNQLTSPPKDELTYARYGLWHYVIRSQQKQEPYVNLQRAGANLRGLVRVLLFKRFESSVYAFRETVGRLLRGHQRFLAALQQEIVPAGQEAENILYETRRDYVPNQEEEQDIVDALREVSDRYSAADFDMDRLQKHIEHDIRLLKEILALVEPITADQDAKLQRLKGLLAQPPVKGHKCLIFTQYADTARYLYDNINPDGKHEDIDVIYSGSKDKERLVGRFAPKVNDYKFQLGEIELSTVIATDVLAEGLNLQDCDAIINYDLHWNPVRLIQRFGRIDRIGTESEVVYAFNFLPEIGIERNLGLRQKLHNRIQEIHDTIGEDAAILDRTEELNTDAMYAIYERGAKGGPQVQQLDLFSKFTDDEESFLNLNEAEEILRLLKNDNKTEYEHISNLRDGIRTAMPPIEGRSTKGLYVFCQAGNYQQLFLVNEQGEIISRDIPRVLGAIQCDTPEIQGCSVPIGYNAAVMSIKRMFDEEVRNRQSEKKYSQSHTPAQRYVQKELQVYYDRTEDDEIKEKINKLENAFRGTLTQAAKKDLNLIKNNGMAGERLVKNLTELYHRHDLGKTRDHRDRQVENNEISKIICSEWLS